MSDRKFCNKCSTEKDVSEFHRDASRKSGLWPSCKECKNAATLEWRRARAEQIRAYDRERYARLTPEQKRARGQKAWAAADREKTRGYSRAYYQRNKEKILAAAKQWRKENPELVRALRQAHRKAKPHMQANAAAVRRARIRGTMVGPVDLEALWTGSCGICGGAMTRDARFPDNASPSIDHIIPLSKGGGHVVGNLQWAHLGCNKIKADKLPNEEAA